MAFKLEVLYFGDPALLNIRGYYARTDWNTIRMALGFKTTDHMLTVIKRSGDFMMIGKNAGFTSRWLMAHSDDNGGQNIDLFAAEETLDVAESQSRICDKKSAESRKCDTATTCSEQENCPENEESSREARAAEYIPAKGNNRGSRGKKRVF